MPPVGHFMHYTKLLFLLPIAVHNLNEHPSLYNTNDLGSEDPLTKLRPRVQKCLEFITNEHFTDDFHALRRYCDQVLK